MRTGYSRRPVRADPAYVIFTSGSTGLPIGRDGSSPPGTQPAPVDVADISVRNQRSGLPEDLKFVRRLDLGIPRRLASGGPDGNRARRGSAGSSRSRSIFSPIVMSRVYGSSHRSCGVMLDTIDDSSGIDFPTSALSGHHRRAGPRPALRAFPAGGTETPCSTTSMGRRRYGTPTWWDPEREEAPGHRVPIGQPIDNVPVYVLDKRLQPVPIAVPGELCVGGLALADGYVGLPALTEQRFIPNPFPQVPGSRLYRTGDLARFRADGCIEFLGRRDQQVKIRGFRVEPSEVESALARHPTVKAVAVTAYDSPRGETARRLRHRPKRRGAGHHEALQGSCTPAPARLHGADRNRTHGKPSLDEQREG